MYTVLHGDIINSKQINMQEIKNRLGLLSSSWLLCPVEVRKGDEFELLISDPVAAVSLLRSVRFVLHPYQVRIGMAIGEVDRETIHQESTWEMHGQVFRDADEALKRMGKTKESQTRFLNENMILSTKINQVLKQYDETFIDCFYQQDEKPSKSGFFKIEDKLKSILEVLT